MPSHTSAPGSCHCLDLFPLHAVEDRIWLVNNAAAFLTCSLSWMRRVFLGSFDFTITEAVAVQDLC
ncbi:MAG TPA: hypothetical protein VFV38_17035 [Ktedonobacteraceae bacterium]|nr:hypothetical protein [Ktedonobacteraceae bacterium]